MYRIVIFGTGRSCKVVENALNEKNKIVAYCDNDSSKWYKRLKGIDIIPPSELKNIKYDYIIIASQYNESIYNELIQMKIEQNKIFQFFKYVDASNNIVLKNINNLLENNNDVETIVTGISYAKLGIDVSQFSKKTYNLASASQDLYYDYNIIKYLLENYKNDLKKLKNVIIGLCYYSFEYDMSLSAMKNKLCFYYEALGLEHHGKGTDAICKYKDTNIETAQILFKCDSKGNINVDWLKDNKDVCKINEESGKRQALMDGNKNYPKTVEENTKIFSDFLVLLKDNNINPIVLVFPVTKYYSENFPVSLKNEFYGIVKKAQCKYEFKFLDYSEKHDFKDDEFYDVTHFNSKGAKRFSKLLDREV